MLSLTNQVVPQKLNKNLKDMRNLVGVGVVNQLKVQPPPQVIQKHQNMGRKTNVFYQKQTPGIVQSMLGKNVGI